MEKVAHGAFAASSKAYITFDYGNLQQVQMIADTLSEHELMNGVVSKQSCLFDVVEETTQAQKDPKTKGNNNISDIDELVFLNVILDRERFFAENRGIRKQLNTNNISLYSVQKEAISGKITSEEIVIT